MKSNRGPGTKKPQAYGLRLPWSGGGDLNSRPLRPEDDEDDSSDEPEGE